MLTRQEVLELLPQKEPFRFLDEILDLNDDGIVSKYRFKEDETFYPGHFPGNPLTPGVILLETMAQTGVVAFGIYLAGKKMTREELERTLTVFTEAEVEFSGMVRPGETVTVEAKKIYFRRLKLKVSAELRLPDGSVAASATIAGMGVPAP